MGRARRKSKRKKNLDIQGYLLIALSLVCLSGLAGIYIYFDQKKIPIDKATLCPESGARGVLAVLIDASDTFSETQRKEIVTHLQDIKNDVPQHHKLAIYTITSDGLNAVNNTISVCNPGVGEDANPFVSNPQLIKQKWVENYSSKVNGIFSQVVVASQLDRSPIMEGIRQIGISEFMGKGNDEIPKRLIIFSDMMQHSSLHSHYKNAGDYKAATAGKEYGSMVKLNGAEVEIFYLSSPSLARYQNRSHVEFWQTYFSYADGLLASVTRISK